MKFFNYNSLSSSSDSSNFSFRIESQELMSAIVKNPARKPSKTKKDYYDKIDDIFFDKLEAAIAIKKPANMEIGTLNKQLNLTKGLLLKILNKSQKKVGKTDRGILENFISETRRHYQ
jgi:hypothetical protein